MEGLIFENYRFIFVRFDKSEAKLMKTVYPVWPLKKVSAFQIFVSLLWFVGTQNTASAAVGVPTGGFKATI